MSELSFEKNQPISLCETLDRLLSTGVVLLGGATISVAEIDLIYVGVQLVITSVHTSQVAPAEQDDRRNSCAYLAARRGSLRVAIQVRVQIGFLHPA